MFDLVQKKLGRDFIETDIDLMEVLGYLEEITSAVGEYTLDFSKFDDQTVGLPYAIPFVFRRNGLPNSKTAFASPTKTS